tara:strand:- start:220 stop:771 length:552 start_codon:yes stop_codon:yes gene_type:complete
VSNILITPIKIDGTHYCLQTSGFTVPILGGMASTTPKMPSSVTGRNTFNVYQALGNTDPTAPANEFRDAPAKTGSIKFGVHPCAESIAIQVVGRADVYDSSNTFDNLTITIDGVQEAYFSSIRDTSVPDSAPFDQVTSYNQTVTKTFSTDVPCGHIVNISGASGTFANNNVGYDVRISVTLPT